MNSRAATSAMCLPTAAEPVKDSTRGIGWVMNASPMVSMLVTTTFNSPGQAGMLEDPADERAAGDRVSSCGLSTTPFPAASAGATDFNGQEEREVARADHADHTDRDPVDPVLLVLQCGGQDLADHASREGRRFLEDVEDKADLERGLEPGAADLVDDQAGDLVGVVLDAADRARKRPAWRRR